MIITDLLLVYVKLLHFVVDAFLFVSKKCTNLGQKVNDHGKIVTAKIKLRIENLRENNP